MKYNGKKREGEKGSGKEKKEVETGGRGMMKR